MAIQRLGRWGFNKLHWEVAYCYSKVTYAQPILDAFNELWDRINSNENLVWKSERS